ncbi:AraC family transcriptional regulator [Ancylomarina euxinus]|uniref:AraC family transcriptional regulator n=1 Tax=Ancylomarina euxinus TaxID=2283627 RepID=A0A425Y1J2_9BACT|nr:helix-turn-helix domain-containing protein [Ancylomarina euxinus]MCZ4695174.1 helix-turn-helix domain-containing protein [Ancylomarina euxinus]MUP14892.1 helix-turn-helix domain-containing protein [Ancylomarina euxinus]RRG21787.1 AraC family transcriptional regulator [Ancylomarina euxinus]
MIEFHTFQSEMINKYIHKIYSSIQNEISLTHYNCLPSVYPILTFLFHSEAEFDTNKVTIKHSKNGIQCILILPYSKTLNICNSNPSKEISIVFKPFSIHNFSAHISLETRSNGVVDTDKIWPSELLALNKKLLASDISIRRQINEIILFLEKQFISHSGINKKDCSPKVLFESIMQLPERSLYRKFKKYSFLAPKQFEKIIRIRKALNQAKQNEETSLTQIAHEQDYFDQAHFNKECQNMASISPGKIIKNMLDRDSDALWYQD